MRDHNIPRIVFSSTAAVYGNPESIPITEESRKDPINPYGRSKLAFEYLLKSYEEAYGIRFAVLRYFNAAGAYKEYGEDHSPETHLIPLTLQVALGKREHISIFGTDYDTPDGTCLRDYIHVKDLADAHLLALEAIENQSVICNLGNGQGFSVRDVIETCRSVSGHSILAREEARREGDPARLTASAQSAKTKLGWNPQITDLQSIVETAWEWHSNHPNGYDS
jgi:UDP-glucose 4-epimerase